MVHIAAYCVYHLCITLGGTAGQKNKFDKALNVLCSIFQFQALLPSATIVLLHISYFAFRLVMQVMLIMKFVECHLDEKKLVDVVNDITSHLRFISLTAGHSAMINFLDKVLVEK